MKKITIEITPDGESSIDLEGFHGKGCADVLKDFAGEDACKHVRSKREFHESEPQKERAKS
jgi:hypothetical protein